MIPPDIARATPHARTRPPGDARSAPFRLLPGIELPVRCAVCKESGTEKCLECDGSGRCTCPRCDDDHECRPCEGSGETPCSGCDGLRDAAYAQALRAEVFATLLPKEVAQAIAQVACALTHRPWVHTQGRLVLEGRFRRADLRILQRGGVERFGVERAFAGRLFWTAPAKDYKERHDKLLTAARKELATRTTEEDDS